MRGKAETVDFIKIDIEGAEALAVKGAKEVLRKNRDITVIMEFFPYFIKTMGSSPEELIKSLIDELKFNIFIIGHDYAMEKSNRNFVKVGSYEELDSFITEETGHVNLILSRRPEIA